MAYTPITSRKIPPGTQSTHTYGPQADGRDYGESHNGGLLGWLTHVASSTNVEFLDVYLRSGETLSIYTDYIAGTIPAQSGQRIIRPAGVPGEASWQGHNGTKNAGVGFNPSGSTGTIAGFETGSASIRFYDLILYSKTGLRFLYGMSFTGVLAAVGCVLVRAGSTPTAVTQNAVGAYAPSGTLYLVNNIFSGFYEGFRGEVSSNSAFFNNTFVDMVSRGLYWDTGAGTNHQAKCYNNVFYNCGATSTYPAGLSGTNVTLNASTDLADYAGGDYRLSATASEALGQGTNLSSDSSFSFDDDINNELRSAPWDIGADKYSVSAIYADLSIARQIMGFADLSTARQVMGFKDLTIARNIGDVFDFADLSIARQVMGFSDLSIERQVMGFVDLTISRHVYGTVLGYSSLTPYFKRKIYDAVLGIAPFTCPPFYLGFSSTNPLADGSGITELSGNNYSRIRVTVWGSPANGILSSSEAVMSPRASGPWDEFQYYFWADAETNGNILGVGTIFEPISITGNSNSGEFIVFQIGSLKIGLGSNNVFDGFSNSILEAVASESPIPSGDIEYGLSTTTPNIDGTFTEVSSDGYSRVTNNEIYLINGFYANYSSIDFPAVLSGHDWGLIDSWVMFINTIPFLFGELFDVEISNTLYGVDGYTMPANSVVIEVQ